MHTETAFLKNTWYVAAWSHEIAQGSMLATLPQQLNDPEIVVEARQTIRDWIGDINIEPGENGPVDRWSLSESGLRPFPDYRLH